jgi:hypothetical protein
MTPMLAALPLLPALELHGLWHAPDDLASCDLYYGPWGAVSRVLSAIRGNP